MAKIKKKGDLSLRNTELMQSLILHRASLMTQMVKNLPAMGSNPGSGKIPWRWNWLSIPVFLPGEFHGQRSLTGPWGSQRAGHD